MAMAVVGAQVSVGVAATLLTAVEADAISGSAVTVRVPSGGSTVYLGGATVDDTGANAGFAVASGEALSIDLDPGESLYGVVASGSQTVHVLRSGV
jgi:hypothetical protein